MQSNSNFDQSRWRGVSKLVAAAVFLASCGAMRVEAQQAGQKTFRSAQAASAALVDAAKDNDEQAMLAILGPDAKRIVSSGDETEDAASRSTFVQRYTQMHRLVKEPNGTTTLYVGAENWPMPIPLVEKAGTWYFDTAAGQREILYRRIGRNEMSTMRVCKELVAAQKEYYSSHNGEYAQKIFSDEGKQDGLYWKTGAGQLESPIGPLVAAAVSEDYALRPQGATATPYRGYLYHALVRQGANAKGGAKNYVVGGRMTGGFAFVAYPAEYRSSGVMTFIVNGDGTVYEKDLGPNTAAIAKAMKTFNPDSTWKNDDVPEEQPATEQPSK